MNSDEMFGLHPTLAPDTVAMRSESVSMMLDKGPVEWRAVPQGAAYVMLT